MIGPVSGAISRIPGACEAGVHLAKKAGKAVYGAIAKTQVGKSIGNAAKKAASGVKNFAKKFKFWMDQDLIVLEFVPLNELTDEQLEDLNILDLDAVDVQNLGKRRAANKAAKRLMSLPGENGVISEFENLRRRRDLEDLAMFADVEDFTNDELEMLGMEKEVQDDLEFLMI